MKVYVVEWDVYEQRTIMGIYASLKAALDANPPPEPRHIPGVQTDPSPYKRRDGWWQPDDYGGWWNGYDMGWCGRITEYELEGAGGAAIGEAPRLLTERP